MPEDAICRIIRPYAVVVGTTGWYDQLPAVTERAARAGGSLFWAANFSLGANIMIALAREAGRLVRGLPHFDAQLVETHHAMKEPISFDFDAKHARIGSISERGASGCSPVTI